MTECPQLVGLFRVFRDSFRQLRQDDCQMVAVVVPALGPLLCLASRASEASEASLEPVRVRHEQ